MLTISRWVLALAILGVAAASRPATASRALAERVEASLRANPAAAPIFEAPRVRASTERTGRKVVDARLIRVRRTNSQGPGALASAGIAFTTTTGPGSPLQLLPSPACIQDHLDRCTRSPRPPPRA